MNTIRELFVSYSQVDDEEPVFQLVEDREAVETIKHSAPLFKRIGSIVNVDSVNEWDPIITIACVTDHFLKAGEPQAITQSVVDWLRRSGQMWA